MRRQRWVGLVAAVIVAASAGCGHAQETATTLTTASMLCSDLKQFTPPIGVSGDPTSPLNSAEGQSTQYAATLPYWERLQRDAPDEAATSIATIVDGFRRAANLDRSLTPAQAAAAIEAIIADPGMVTAMAQWGDFTRGVCNPGEQASTATR